MAFCASTLNESSARLGGVVTGKRVAARQRLAEDFGLGSVSMHFSSAEGLEPEEVGTNSFFANRRSVWKWFLACRNAIGKRFLADRRPSPSGLPLAKMHAASAFSPAEIRADVFFQSGPIAVDFD